MTAQTEPKSQPATTATTAAATTTEAAPAFQYKPLNKKGELYRAEGNGRIWAGIVGSCYLSFKNLDNENEWGEKGRAYELYVTYIRVGESYSMWADGYWELDKTGTKLRLTPKNQSENGNIGAEVGKSKTFTGANGVFQIPITFERGGKTTVTLDLSRPV